MPRGGAFILSDVRGLTLSIVCGPCSRRKTYSVAASWNSTATPS